MDFAKKLMAKYGWKEGDGLGKKQTGIRKPLKANLKFDTSGLGVDKAADFNNHWWERVFNEAANNIEVVKSVNNDIKLNIKDADSVEISTKEYSVKKFKKHRRKDGYNNFFKASTLTSLGVEEVKDKIQMSDIENTKFKPLSDEELFAACGGRTAHKGARHGLKLSGKLSRIEEQEKELLERMQKTSGQAMQKDEAMDEANEPDEEWVTVKNKKRNKTVKFSKEEVKDDLNKDLFSSEHNERTKKKKKKKLVKENDLSFILNSVSMVANRKENEVLLISKNSKTIKKTKNKEKKSKSNYDFRFNKDKVNHNYGTDFSEEADTVDTDINEDIPVCESYKEKLPNKKLKKNKKKVEKLKKVSKCETKKLSKKLKKNMSTILNEFETSVKIMS